ncbi:hypothetical protein GCM10027613_13820 [Microlunatus endophyticus]
MIAISGIELALWDIAGKAMGQPVYRLLGGKFRDRIRVYADCGDGDDPEGSIAGCVDRAQRMVSEGFTAIKFDIDNLGHPAKFDRYNHTLGAGRSATWSTGWPRSARPSGPMSISPSTCTPATTCQAPAGSRPSWSRTP